jgi:hypothetical protein
MKKICTIFFVLLFKMSFAQEIEIGGNLDFVFPNIIDTSITPEEGRAAVGKSLFNLSNGYSLIFNFKGATSESTSGIQFEYQRFDRGSRSENCNNCEYRIKSENINIYYRKLRRFDRGWRLFVDAGFGYNKIDNSDIYKGSLSEIIAFPKIGEPLKIKSQEFTFLFDMGVEKVFLNKIVTSFRFISGNIAMTNINESSRRLQNQGIGFGFSARYLINLTKTELKQRQNN